MALDLADRVALAELAMVYVDAVNMRDEARWANCWCPEARWHISSGELVGVDAIVEKWVGAMASFDRVVQLYGGIVVDEAAPGATEVTARVHFSEEIWQGDERIVDRRFVYLDRCRRTEGGWRYLERQLNESGWSVS